MKEDDIYIYPKITYMKIFVTNFKKFRLTLQIIYFALLQWILLTMAIFYFSAEKTYYKLDLSDTKILIGGMLVISALVFSPVLFRFMLSFVNREKAVKYKLSGYTTAYVLKMMILEVAAIVNLIFFEQSGNNYFMIFSVFPLLMMMFSYPAFNKLEGDLKSSMKESSYFRNTDKEFE